jgi:Putative zinc ribbon domain
MVGKCQSCGMPMSRDPNGGGSNKDRSKNALYCSFCYQNGAFTQPDFTVEKMQEFCIGKMKEMGIPKFLGWLFTRHLPKLERWKNS